MHPDLPGAQAVWRVCGINCLLCPVQPFFHVRSALTTSNVAHTSHDV